MSRPNTNTIHNISIEDARKGETYVNESFEKVVSDLDNAVARAHGAAYMTIQAVRGLEVYPAEFITAEGAYKEVARIAENLAVMASALLKQ